MSESITVYQQVKQFVDKYNNDGLDFVKNPNTEQQSIITNLANAVSSFEMAEREQGLRRIEQLGLKDFTSSYNERVNKYNFETTLSNLNRWIKIAKGNDVYIDSKLKKEMEDFKVEKEQIQKKMDGLNTQNTNLLEDNIKFRKGLRKLFDENPEIDDKYGWLLENPKIGENKLE